MRSVEGKTENIAFFPPRDVAWILAWKSRSWDDFSRLTAIMRGKGYIVSPWTLLVLSAETGHDPSGWLSFELPYRSIQDGFVNLCRLQDEMEIVVKGSESMSVFKWASKLDCQTKEMIFSAVKRHLIRKGRKFMSVGIVMSLIGISTGTLILTHNRDRDLVILAFVCGGLFVIGGGILIAAAVHQFSLRSKLDRSL